MSYSPADHGRAPITPVVNPIRPRGTTPNEARIVVHDPLFRYRPFSSVRRARIAPTGRRNVFVPTGVPEITLASGDDYFRKVRKVSRERRERNRTPHWRVRVLASFEKLFSRRPVDLSGRPPDENVTRNRRPYETRRRDVPPNRAVFVKRFCPA